MRKTLIGILLAAMAGCEDKKHNPLPQPEQKPIQKYMRVVTKEDLAYGLSLECFPDRVMMYRGSSCQTRRLHFREAENEDKPNLQVQEYAIMTDVYQRFTHILEYVGRDPRTQELLFWDMAKVDYLRVPYNPETNTAYLDLAEVVRKIKMNPNTEALAIDQDGNGEINGEELPIVYRDDSALRERDMMQR